MCPIPATDFKNSSGRLGRKEILEFVSLGTPEFLVIAAFQSRVFVGPELTESVRCRREGTPRGYIADESNRDHAGGYGREEKKCGPPLKENVDCAHKCRCQSYGNDCISE